MFNVQSPRTDDAAIEQAIKDKGLTAPRITLADIEANIDSEHYFTAAQGSLGAAIWGNHNVTISHDVDFNDNSPPLNLLTFCVLILKNGFTVTGESACASPENFDSEIGKRIAKQNAVNKVWPLMGFALKNELAAAQRAE